jgi:hypothetical protein
MLSRHNAADHDALLTEVSAADILHLSIRTLQSWRSKKLGPPFVRAGRAVRYRRGDLIQWIDANTVSASATPAGGAQRQP